MQINEEEINNIVKYRRQIAEYDELIKIYLRSNATQQQRDQLLDYTLKYLNDALIKERAYRETIKRLLNGEQTVIIIDERYKP